MPQIIGPHKDVATVDESYADGFKTGVEWTWNHVPGGPWICQDRYATGWFRDYCDATAKNNEAWMRGWHDGRAQKQRNVNAGIALYQHPRGQSAVLGCRENLAAS